MPDSRLTRQLGSSFGVSRRKVRGAARAAGGWLDDTLGGSRVLREELRHIFPDHWSFFFGEIALYSFIVLVVTGVFMALFFSASQAPVVYHGSYKPLDGATVSAAYRSVLDLNFDVRGGLLVRQIHHWAALLFAGAVSIHLARLFFTGAYRRPRRVNWLVGLGLLTMVFTNGVFGYSLPDDLLSGTGLRIAYSITQSIPLVGPQLASLMFGGSFPSETLIARIYPVHIFLIPALIAGLLGAHLGLLWLQRHTEYPGRGRDDRTIVGTPMMPAYALRTTGFFMAVAGLLAIMGGFFQINPVWLYGPYTPWDSTSFAQPDWYTGWLEGAVRMMPSWDIHTGSYALPALFWPAAVLPGLIVGFLVIWPWLDAAVTGRGFHNVLDPPSARPGRMAIALGLLTFVMVLLVGGGNDVFAVVFHWHQPTLLATLQLLVAMLPFVIALLAYLIFRAWRRAATAVV
jgi:ubiquinol-cytochrome c reductase cytochrome b subunit